MSQLASSLRAGLLFVILGVFMLDASATGVQPLDHGEGDQITSLDGNGNGTFSGTLTHLAGSAVPHPWYTFDARVGFTVTVQVSSPGFDNYVWIYRVNDDQAEIGDALFVDYVLVASGEDPLGNTLTTLNFAPPADGQYVIQIDSFDASDGPYTLTVTGAVQRVLLIEDQSGFGTADALLTADGHFVTTLNNEFAAGYTNLSNTDVLAGFDMVVWGGRGAGGNLHSGWRKRHRYRIRHTG
jgi:hypothetical protein